MCGNVDASEHEIHPKNHRLKQWRSKSVFHFPHPSVQIKRFESVLSTLFIITVRNIYTSK